MRLWILLAPVLLTAPASAQPAPLTGFSDNGTFLLYLDEEVPGRLTTQWKADGHFSSTLDIHAAGQDFHTSLVITPDAHGRWIRSVFEDTHGNKTIAERTGEGFTFAMPGRNGKSDALPEDLVLFEESSPALISLALRQYDQAQGGKQMFAFLELSKIGHDPLTLERQDAVERSVGGRRLKLTNWLYSTTGYDLHVLAGDDARVYVVAGLPWYSGVGISEQHALYVREGYESLRPSSADPLLSQPTFDVRMETVQIPMRDGVNLAADVYFPVGVAKAPVVLTRTPYGKFQSDIRSRFWARRGYIRIIQDVRGRFASQGQFEGLIHEPKDGYDTIEWLARQPWCNGKVGMIGGSYLGWVQWMAAVEHPPHLVTIIPNVSPPDPFHNLPYENGVPGLQVTMPWLNMVELNMNDPEEAAAGKNWSELLSLLPVIDIDKKVLGRESLTWRHWFAHPTADDYWRGVMFLDKLKNVRIPVFHQSGWFDGDGIGSKLNYLAMAAGHATQKMTIGPWGHTDAASRETDDRDYGAAAAIDLQRDYLRWFDYWLKGVDNGILKDPLVSLFTMGSNRWVYGAKYPLPQTRFEKLYLGAGGRLTFTPPAASEAEDHYVYDPGAPTQDAGCGVGSDVKVTTAGKDILVYSTAPFEKPYTLAGPVSAVLYASSSAPDTDWFVHLLDVDADGICRVLWSSNSGGHLRARYRNSLVKTQPIVPGKIYKYTIDMWHTGFTVPPGHRLRVGVASADFPLFARNLNTGGNNETETRFVTARQAIYHDARRPSYVLLPRIPD